MNKTFNQGTVLKLRCDLIFKRVGKRPVIGRQGDEFWVTNTKANQTSIGFVKIDRIGKGLIGSGFAVEKEDIEKFFEESGIGTIETR